MEALAKIRLFPTTTEIGANDHLIIGGCDTVELAREFGTPLYLFDEATLRGMCRQFRQEFSLRHADSRVIYACKAFINRAVAQIFMEEGLGLDIVSGGELAIARSVGFPAAMVYFHGNNKGREELREALEAGVGRVVVDNFHELALLEALAEKMGMVQDIMVRLSPGVDPHTHAHTTTGVLDSKFGFPVATGQAEDALRQALAARHLQLVGLHFHLGSPIFELEPYREAIGVVLDFAAVMAKAVGFALREFSPGGGFAIAYTTVDAPPTVADYAEAIISALKDGCQRHSLPLPRLVVEPGRAIVGRAGVALYQVGATKNIPGVRHYVSVDGGMADNIRPALYGARYEAAVANRVCDAAEAAGHGEKTTIAGKFCESGDVLIRDSDLPRLAEGDIIALPAAGAYCLSMASNYNASLKPPILIVAGGQARLIRRRETYDDLMRCDLS